jgi:hypothetical protein
MNRIDNDSTRTFILTRYIRDQISRQLPSELQLLEIKPDSLQFQFASLSTRQVAVSSDLRFDIDRQFTIKDDVILEPDSVIIKGPDIIIDTMSSVYTKRIELGVLSKSYSGDVELKPLENVAYSQNTVHCNIELEKFTELAFYIPVSVMNLPDSISIQTFPSKVKVTCNVGLSRYDRIDEKLIRATIDYQRIQEGNNRLQVSLSNMPAYVRSFDYNPKTVEFLLSSK